MAAKRTEAAVKTIDHDVLPLLRLAAADLSRARADILSAQEWLAAAIAELDNISDQRFALQVEQSLRKPARKKRAK